MAGIVVDIALLFRPGHDFWEFWGGLVANGLIGLGLVVEYVVIGRAIVATGEANRLSDQAVAEANERAAKANEIASIARDRAAQTELQLEFERKLRAPRALSEEQRDALRNALAGKLAKVRFVVQRGDLEAKNFANTLASVFSESGIETFWTDMPAGEIWHSPGVGMYSPNGAKSVEELAEDPLYIALKNADLFGGHVTLPFVSFNVFEGQVMAPPDTHIVYVGQKGP